MGGALDMTGEVRLDGAVVLVVEDEFYIAADTARALQGAGADVVGPFRTEKAARSAVEEQRPDVVVVDINLGAGPSFKLAETLKDKGIPFVFVTGYDQQVIPDEFSDVQRLEKPVQLRRVVSAVSNLLNPAA
jgi:DNA-binding response OmpR family regulator